MPRSPVSPWYSTVEACKKSSWDKADLVKANRNRKKAVAANTQNLKEQQREKLRELVAWEAAQAQQN